MSDPLIFRDVYGYCVIYKRPDEHTWTVDQDEDYSQLPAHYLQQDEANDRVEFLRSKGLLARSCALFAENDEVDGIEPEEPGYDDGGA